MILINLITGPTVRVIREVSRAAQRVAEGEDGNELPVRDVQIYVTKIVDRNTAKANRAGRHGGQKAAVDGMKCVSYDRRMRNRNPFYVLLIVVGIVFAITACAYAIMAIGEVRASARIEDPQPPHPLLQWVRENGDMALLVELGALALLTCAAIGTDRFWDRS